MKTEIAVCDDEKNMRERCMRELRMMAREEGMQVEVEGYGDPVEFYREIEEGAIRPQILYLDIHMPRMDGMELATKLRSIGYQGEIIFWTVSHTEVFRAFDVAAFQYLVKERYTRERFKEVFCLAYEKVKDRESRYIQLSRGSEIHKIALAQIQYFESKNRIITVYYGDGEQFSFYSTIGKLEERLGGFGFHRISRAHLVNTETIETLKKREVIMKDKSRIPISIASEKELREILIEMDYRINLQKMTVPSGKLQSVKEA